jgi:Holliday junction resolvasome RuvABC ATP-dependent DNA helicase subunit
MEPLTEIATRIKAAPNVDAFGLDEMDNKILNTIIDKFKGGPCRFVHTGYRRLRAVKQ